MPATLAVGRRAADTPIRELRALQLDSASNAAQWRGQRVFRTDLLLRFHDTVPEQRRVEFLRRRDIVPVQQWLGRTLVVKIPDPGPAPGNFERTVTQLAAAPEVREVLPFALASRAPAHDLIRMRASVVDLDRRPLSGVHLCWSLPDVQLFRGQNCAMSNDQGAVSLVPLGVGEAPLYALCRLPGEVVARPLDSVWVVVGPTQTTDLAFVLSATRCDPRIYQERSGQYSGLLFLRGSARSFTTFEGGVAWVSPATAATRWQGWPKGTKADGCFQVALQGILSGPAAFGPDGRYQLSLQIQSVVQVKPISRRSCWSIAVP